MEISLYIMSVLYILAGVMHFVAPKFYLRIMPRYIPYHNALVVISGVVEIILGILLLFPAYRTLAAWGIIALLIAIFPANINHLTSAKPGKGPPLWLLYMRLPIQGVLIWWAYLFT